MTGWQWYEPSTAHYPCSDLPSVNASPLGKHCCRSQLLSCLARTLRRSRVVQTKSSPRARLKWFPRARTPCCCRTPLSRIFTLVRKAQASAIWSLRFLYCVSYSLTKIHPLLVRAICRCTHNTDALPRCQPSRRCYARLLVVVALPLQCCTAALIFQIS